MLSNANRPLRASRVVLRERAPTRLSPDPAGGIAWILRRAGDVDARAGRLTRTVQAAPVACFAESPPALYETCEYVSDFLLRVISRTEVPIGHGFCSLPNPNRAENVTGTSHFDPHFHVSPFEP